MVWLIATVYRQSDASEQNRYFTWGSSSFTLPILTIRSILLGLRERHDPSQDTSRYQGLHAPSRLTIGIQWESKNGCGIRGLTIGRKGNTYLVILVSWILAGGNTMSLSNILPRYIHEIDNESTLNTYLSNSYLICNIHGNILLWWEKLITDCGMYILLGRYFIASLHALFHMMLMRPW